MYSVVGTLSMNGIDILLEAQKTFRRLKAYRQLPILRNALQEHLRKAQADSAIETIMKAA